MNSEDLLDKQISTLFCLIFHTSWFWLEFFQWYHWYGSFFYIFSAISVIDLCMSVLNFFRWYLHNGSEIIIMQVYDNTNHKVLLDSYMFLFEAMNFEMILQQARLLYHMTFFIITLTNISDCSSEIIDSNNFSALQRSNGFLLLSFISLMLEWTIFIESTVVYKRIKLFIWWRFGLYARNFRRIQATFKLVLPLCFRF